ncbi:MAG: hypothetical protein EOP04_14890 [Proteobacteria bacterium]|nr:MAG: hypothetical protein EOP04_14890 [Pseudomonadota bacterium]
MVNVILSLLIFSCVLCMLLVRKTQTKITAAWGVGFLVSVLLLSLNLEYLAFIELCLASVQLVVFLHFLHLLRSIESGRTDSSNILRSRVIFWSLLAMHLLLGLLFAMYFHGRFFEETKSGLSQVSALELGTALIERYQPVMIILSLLFLISGLAVGIISSIRAKSGEQNG